MASDAKPLVIAIEEHYLDKDVDAKINSKVGGVRKTRDRLLDLGEGRLKDMDDAGIDIQVLSHCPPGAQAFDKDEAVRMARVVNDRLYDTVQSKPDRFSAFASLPTRNPEAAADELERCVNDLGFKGAMLHGLTDQKFHDLPEFRPIFSRAETLDVPIYIHPGPPHPAVIEAYYKEYTEKFRTILTAGWAFTVETATAGLRLVLSGVFDEHPNLKIILGHMGEGLPFLLWRINSAIGKSLRNDDEFEFRDLFCKHFYITTSGNFSNAALLCSVMEMGVDRILFSVDWPYAENAQGTNWMKGIPLGEEDRAKILNGNARRLLKM